MSGRINIPSSAKAQQNGRASRGVPRQSLADRDREGLVDPLVERGRLVRREPSYAAPFELLRGASRPTLPMTNAATSRARCEFCCEFLATRGPGGPHEPQRRCPEQRVGSTTCRIRVPSRTALQAGGHRFDPGPLHSCGNQTRGRPFPGGPSLVLRPPRPVIVVARSQVRPDASDPQERSHVR